MSADAIELAGLVATSGPVARASGDARIPLRDAAARGQWQLELSRLDLARIHSKLAPTRLSGRLRAALSGTEQQLDGDLRQDDLGASFAATVAGNAVEVTRLRARAGQGEFNGRARYDFSGAQRFEVAGKALRFDPAQFGAFPSARLDGELRAAGALQPAWHADVAIALAPSSRLREAPLSGRLSGRVTATTLQDATIDLALAGARLKARGGYGPAARARIDATFDIPDTASVLVPLADWVPVVARGCAGASSARGRSGTPPASAPPRSTRSGENLALDALAAGTVEVHAEVARLKADPRITLSVAGTRLTTPVGSYASWSGTLSGTASAHRLQAALVGAGIDADFVAEGGLADGRWSGSLMHFANRGTYAAKLAAPAQLELGAGQVVVGEARLAVAGGNVRIDGFRWVDGVATGKGTFDAVPLAAIAEMAGSTLPLRSTLSWPASGTSRHAAAHRQADAAPPAGRPLRPKRGPRTPGKSRWAFHARRGRRRRWSTARWPPPSTPPPRSSAPCAATCRSVAAPAPMPGRSTATAPLSGTLTATLSSLAPLQPFIGTAARVDGRVDAELRRGEAPGGDHRQALRRPGCGSTPRSTGCTGATACCARARRRSADAGRVLVPGRRRAFTADPAPSSGDHTGQKSVRCVRGRHRDRTHLAGRPAARDQSAGPAPGRLRQRRSRLRRQASAVSGTLKVDEGRVDIETAAPGTTLGDDVVIVAGRGRRRRRRKRFGAVPFGLDPRSGPGCNSPARGCRRASAGRIRVSAVPDGVLTAKGTLRTVNGSYYAFGQRLTIERGRLIFDGPIDNPALDIIALRKNLQVEAGVGSPAPPGSPRIELTSEPPVPDGEKLSWLVLGQGLDQTTTAATPQRSRPPQRCCSAAAGCPSAPRSRSRSDSTTSRCGGSSIADRQQRPRRQRPGARRRKTAVRQALHRLRAGAVRCQQRAQDRVRADPQHHAARRGGVDLGRRDLLSEVVRVAPEQPASCRRRSIRPRDARRGTSPRAGRNRSGSPRAGSRAPRSA